MKITAQFKQFYCKKMGDRDVYILQFHIPKDSVTADVLRAIHSLQGEAVRLAVALAERAEYEEIMEALKGKRVESALDFTADPADSLLAERNDEDCGASPPTTTPRRLSPQQCPNGCPEGFGAVYGPAPADSEEGCYEENAR